MKSSVKGAIAILVLALLCGGLFKGFMWWMGKRAEVASSDAQSKNARPIRIGGDNYLGYFYMRSPEMMKQALRRGLAVNFKDDGGDYADRLKHFANGDYDAIVLPINSYLQHGKNHNYPGVIVAAIAESKGADGMVCYKDKLPSGKVTDLNDPSLKIVYTSESPSSFLLDLAISDFDLYNLKSSNVWRDEVSGSDKALQKAKRHDGACFVMWEPDIMHALSSNSNLEKVWGSDKFSGYIVDVFVFRRDFVKDHFDDVENFFEAYFTTMRAYQSDQPRLKNDISSVMRLDKSEVTKVLTDKEIHWYDMQENASRQFGIDTGNGSGTAEGVLNTIVADTDVLVRTGKLSQDPLDGDPYKIINSTVLKTVAARLPKEMGNSGIQHQFSQLADADWKTLQEIGTMRVDPITFQPGTATLSEDGEKQVDKMADVLAHNYPDDRVVIRGNTDKGSDEGENVRLSQARAQAVMDRLIQVKHIDPNRLRAEGMGSSQPLQKRPDENFREYMQRIPRVEFNLFADAPSY